jgi:HD-GYP domain-containing protein (c-di-GMP phosphodiesterase class II)
MRAPTHYLFAVAALALYGGQVCPFIDSLDLPTWSVILSVFFAAGYALRLPLYRVVVEPAAPERRVARIVGVEWGVFVAMAAGITIYDSLAYDFPLGSGAKIVVACVGLGLFAAVDIGLAEERRLHTLFAAAGRSVIPTGRFMPLTGKFSLAAIVTLLIVTVVATLVVIRDLDWLSTLAKEELPHAYWVVAGEFAFIAAVTLAELVNLILAATGNLKLFFAAQNGTLKKATDGDLTSRVTVVTDNEFGLMGHYTNRMIESLSARTVELQQTRDVTIHAMATLAETRDNETGAHILRTQRYVRALANALRRRPGYADRLDDDTVELLFKSAPLHDIGKVGVPDAILLKPGKLTDGEFAIMKLHAVYGKEALEKAEERLGENSFLFLAREIAYGHHEKWDGSGYPQGLSGETIPLSARLMAVADVYDALISKRVYKPAFSHEKAMGIIREGSATHFDPTLIEILDEVEAEFVDIAATFGDIHTAPAS